MVQDRDIVMLKVTLLFETDFSGTLCTWDARIPGGPKKWYLSYNVLHCTRCITFLAHPVHLTRCVAVERSMTTTSGIQYSSGQKTRMCDASELKLLPTPPKVMGGCVFARVGRYTYRYASVYPAKSRPGSGTTKLDSGEQMRLRRSRIEAYGPRPRPARDGPCRRRPACRRARGPQAIAQSSARGPCGRSQNRPFCTVFPIFTH